jgi:hypothetical protein
MTFAAFKDVVIFLLALYGAALSTLNFWTSTRKDKRTVRVSLSTVMPTFGAELGGCFAKIEAVNIGHRPVTIESLTLELPNGARLWPASRDLFPGVPDTRLPATLADGQSAHLAIPYADIADGLRRGGYKGRIKVKAICLDSVGKVHEGDRWEVDPEEFARM